MPTEYLYGTTIDNLKTTEDKIIYGEKLLDQLLKHSPLDVDRVYNVAKQLNSNNKTLKGGI